MHHSRERVDFNVSEINGVEGWGGVICDHMFMAIVRSMGGQFFGSVIRVSEKASFCSGRWELGGFFGY